MLLLGESRILVLLDDPAVCLPAHIAHKTT